MLKNLQKSKQIALGKHLRFCKEIIQLEIKTNLEDYSSGDLDKIRNAEEILYPTSLYYRFFESIGKKSFPRNFYQFMGNKIRQTLLFQWFDIPHPRTKIYYGKQKLSRIKKDFRYPFVAKQAIGGSQGKEVFLIKNDEELQRYLDKHQPAYIQEYLRTDRDLRVVIFRNHVVHAYWRIGTEGNFRHNVSQGAQISFENIPEKAIKFALHVADKCGFEEVGLDILEYNKSYYVLEANMVYGKIGFKAKGLVWEDIILQLHKKGLF